MIVILPPLFNEGSRLRKIPEPVLIQTFITDFIVQAFGVAVLLRLAGLDIMPVDFMIIRPDKHSRADKFWPVVGHNHLGLASLLHKCLSPRTTRRPGIDVSATRVRHSREH